MSKRICPLRMFNVFLKNPQLGFLSFEHYTSTLGLLIDSLTDAYVRIMLLKPWQRLKNRPEYTPPRFFSNSCSSHVTLLMSALLVAQNMN